MDFENKKTKDGVGCSSQCEGEETIGASVRSCAVKAKESSSVALRGEDRMVMERGSCDDVSIASIETDSDSMATNSDCSVVLERRPPSYWLERLERYTNKKRRLNEEHEGASSGGEEVSSIPKTPTARKIRGRPASTGKYVGLAKAQSELNALKRAEAQRQIEEKVAAQMASHKATRAVAPPTRKEVDSGLASELVKQVGDAAEMILTVATKSSHLKGTFTKALKDSVASIRVAVEALYACSVSEETAKLQADNTRLRAEMADLRKEVLDLKAAMAGASKKREDEPAKQQEELTRSIMLQVGGLISARLEGMEERLLPEKRIRPPLAADKHKEAAEAVKTSPQPSTAKKRKQGAAKEAVVSSQSQPRDLPPVPETMNEGWSTVTKKGRKAKTTAKPTAKPTAQPNGKPTGGGPTKSSAPTRPAKVKLRPPRTAAVIITLQSGAVEKGITYANVIGEAKEKVTLESCGISSLRFRKAATGACILEVAAGDASNEKADNLALKLREALGEELARVSRPMKSAEFRVSGLDDTVTGSNIIDAVAQRGACLAEAVKVGEIKRTMGGTGVALVRCPIVAAKKIGEEGRLLVGWVSAKVEMLQPRPLRCYKCLEVGHVRAQCTAETDRSEECYRCGQTGHKSSTCSATAKCSVCAAAGKSSAHRLGSKACAPPKTRRGKARKTAASCPSTSQTGDERVQMDAD